MKLIITNGYSGEYIVWDRADAEAVSRDATFRFLVGKPLGQASADYFKNMIASAEAAGMSVMRKPYADGGPFIYQVFLNEEVDNV